MRHFGLWYFVHAVCGRRDVGTFESGEHSSCAIRGNVVLYGNMECDTLDCGGGLSWILCNLVLEGFTQVDRDTHRHNPIIILKGKRIVLYLLQQYIVRIIYSNVYLRTVRCRFNGGCKCMVD